MAVKDLKIVGQPVKLRDLDTHVTGETVFYEDVRVPRLLHLKMHRSSYSHAKLLSIDTSAAQASPGVVLVLTHEDLPGKKVYNALVGAGVGPEDEPILAFDKVRWKGESVAAVIAETPEQADAAAAKVKVEYEELPAVFDVEEALKDGAPNVTAHWPNNHYIYPDDHKGAQVRFGDVEKAFAEADYIVEDSYQTQPIEQAPMETNGCIAVPEGDGRITVYSNTQALQFSLDTAAGILDMPANKLRFVGGTVGGGFGGKVDIMPEPITTLAALRTGRPVKFKYTRDEEMRVSSSRSAWRVYIKDGIMNDGRIIARKVTTYQDSGAYLRFSSYASMKHCGHMPGPYSIPNVWVDSVVVFTNRTPSNAMRGFGVMAGSFALEVQMDKIAETIGMDPWELRLINAYREGDMKSHLKPVEDAGMVETILSAAKLAGKELPANFQNMSSLDRKAG
ncbi:MAG: xanthine dehydrogenase family protein molybdopterin-binding subunit [Rhodospirillaceae bacterium]|nr:xanthine dehydrogenase family protein molybdopterin-binding subunit [Rhodospirillaceae bacterium]MBT4426747.1 xanthine dehydrogenase family protein molybdopterin-binding subunit [Rhodospirillaceae bacterium]MBT5780362.1 xanthine dehydrogenase family protein molybdopterin-binding subunit [Rhodospirillaceae bacterium]MBT6828776.1 xanthine dehydrogenase family protein molybdopterin-binding subunit [Rhodospirillaceae bacterium]MBT7291493.1 xanthine dehydrogenase family protein molybdopterin-bind